MSEEPRERIIEVALQELLRTGERPDYAARVRQRWEVQRGPQRARRRAPLAKRPAPTDAPRPRASWTVGAGRLAAALLVAVGATVAWRAWSGAPRDVEPGDGPHSPTTGLAAAPMRELAPGLSALPAAFGEVIVNSTESTLELTLAQGERIELGPLAVLALEQAPEAGAAPARATPRLLDGEATFHAPEAAPDDVREGPRASYRYGLGNSPAALVLDAGGRFRAELARASGPHPLDVAAVTDVAEETTGPEAVAAAAPRSFGRGQLLGPTWLTLQPLAGALTWLDAEGLPRVIDEPLEALVIDAVGTARPLTREELGLLNKLIAAIAPVPGVERLPGGTRFATWEADSGERQLIALLEEEPALWIPVGREFEQRLTSHSEAYWWRGAHAVVAGARSEAALHVARRWWRDGAERFDTDALLALAEGGHEPFVRELEALLENALPRLDEAETRRRLRRGGPDADVDLLDLAALARADIRRVGRVLDLTPPLDAAIRKGTLDGVAARSLLAAATLAREGFRDMWNAARARLVGHVEALAEAGEDMPAALLAAYLDVAAESLGLAPYAADPDQHSPRLAYYERRVRERTMVLQGEYAPLANRPATLDEWLELWRGR